MTKKELIERIKALEARINTLESRPIIIQPIQVQPSYPVQPVYPGIGTPYYPNQYPYNPFWYTVSSNSIPNHSLGQAIGAQEALLRAGSINRQGVRNDCLIQQVLQNTTLGQHNGNQ